MLVALGLLVGALTAGLFAGFAFGTNGARPTRPKQLLTTLIWTTASLLNGTVFFLFWTWIAD